jgi:hypothetical protein
VASGETRLESDRKRNVWPGGVCFTFETPEVHAGHGQARMVKEARDRLDRRPGVPAELRGTMAKDVEPGWRQACRPEIASEAAVESRARDAIWTSTGLPKRPRYIH